LGGVKYPEDQGLARDPGAVHNSVFVLDQPDDLVTVKQDPG
jgi:hypothetical protein